MEFKHNYFLRNMVDLDIKSLAEYLKHSDVNYVIMVNDEPIVFAGDKTPAVFGGEIDVQNELAECELVNENFELKEGVKVLTESDFIKQFCMDAIEDWIIKKIIELNNYDGVCYIEYLDNSFNGVIDINGMTDILNLCVGVDRMLSLLASDENDDKQDFIYITDLPFDIVVKIINKLENYP